jgi:hypothetical protein
MSRPSKQPTEQEAGPDHVIRDPKRAEEATREGHMPRMQMHLSAMPTVKSDLSTHLGITIRWWAAPPRYLAVAIGGPAADRLASGGVRCLAAPGSALRAMAARGGGVAC